MNEFPIRVLSELSGVPPTTLRAWERRYGLLKPSRTPKGHRLYNNSDLETVRTVVRLLEANHPVSKAVRMVREGGEVEPNDAPDASPWSAYRKRLLRAVETFDDGKLDAVYNEALSVYPIDIVTVNLLRPVLELLGGRWQDRSAGIAEEHFFTSYLRNKVGARLHHAGRTRGRRLLMACLPGEQHELGILLFALSAMMRGYRVLYLGPDLPLEQVLRVAGSTDVAGVLLSGTEIELTPALREQLSGLADELNIPLMLGGNSAESREPVLEAIGVAGLGADFPAALTRLESILPAYGSG